MVISLFFSAADGRGWAEDLVMVRYLWFGMALLDISQRLPVGRYCLYGLTAAIVLAAINILAAHLLGHDLIGKPLWRYVKKKKEAARIAGMAAYTAPFFLTWALCQGRPGRLGRVGILGLGVLALLEVYALKARTPLLATLAGVGFGLMGRCPASFPAPRASGPS